MCLYSMQRKAYIAKEDIEVYKLLVKHKDGTYVTPHIYEYVELGEVLKPFIWNENEMMLPNKMFKLISNGWIHSYIDVVDSNFKDWKYHSNWNYLEDKDELVLVKCIIPKGTEYWLDAYMNEICSKVLVIGKEEDSHFKNDINNIIESKYDPCEYAVVKLWYEAESLDDERNSKIKFYADYLKDRFNEIGDMKDMIGKIILEDVNDKIHKYINSKLCYCEEGSVNSDREVIKEHLKYEDGRIGITYNVDSDYLYIPYDNDELSNDIENIRLINEEDFLYISSFVDILNCIIQVYFPVGTKKFQYVNFYKLSDEKYDKMVFGNFKELEDNEAIRLFVNEKKQ